ncbi:MAG: DUF3566 domain-containing protein [Candidatus Humimicrobiaceae bacterium]
MINIERKTVRSISELSSFKFLLIFYLIFFILSVIIMGIIALIAWAGLSSSGINIPDILNSFGIGNFGIGNFTLASIGGGSVLYIVLSIVGGLIASVFYAAFGTLMVWIVNVVLRISGGIELRFIDREVKVKSK